MASILSSEIERFPHFRRLSEMNSRVVLECRTGRSTRKEMKPSFVATCKVNVQQQIDTFKHVIDKKLLESGFGYHTIPIPDEVLQILIKFVVA